MNRILVAITYSTCKDDHENDAEVGADEVHEDLKHFGSPLQTFQTISSLAPLKWGSPSPSLNNEEPTFKS